MAAALFTFIACKGDRTLPAPSSGTPVILISIDTLRSDHLPAYGYQGVTTPNIDALRADGILYERAYSHTPLTLPSHASMLTGLLPADHGVRDNVGFSLKPSVKTIAETLRDKGYATGAAVSAFVLRHEAGLNRGFDFYDDEVEALPDKARLISNIQRDGSATIQVAKDWMTKQEKPVFFMLHLYEPHTPYTPPEPYKSSYKVAYDAEIAHVDQLLGDYIQYLKDQDLYDKALIILLSDHGEGLNEHGEPEHGLFLYREALQVPLIVKLPKQKFKGETVAAPVQLVDLVPTIIDRTSAAAPAANLPGRSLLAFLGEKSPEKRAVYSESYYGRFHYGWADQHSMIDGEKHYIHSPKPELFDLRADFGEKKNILADDRRGYFAMKAAITPLIQQAEAPAAIDPEEAAKLAALGYLGSTVQTKPGEVLPDPKDNIGTFRDIGIAFVHYREKRYQQALELTDSILRTNDRIVDLYDLRSKTLMRLGRAEEAIEAAKAGLRLAPNASHIAIDVASLLLEGGKLDDAQKHAELGLKLDPGQAHEVLARVWLERKNFAKAEEHANLAVKLDRDRAAAKLTVARVKRDAGKLEEALAHLNEAEKVKKPGQEVIGLHFMRGDVLARMGRVEDAEREFRREIELFPEEPLAYKNLVLLLVAEGRTREATLLLRLLVASAPTPPSYLAVCHVLQTLGDERGVRFWARQGLAKFPNNPGLRRLAG